MCSPHLLQRPRIPRNATVSHTHSYPLSRRFCCGLRSNSSNPGTKTIERDLLEALAKAQAFPADMKSDLGKVHIFVFDGVYTVTSKGPLYTVQCVLVIHVRK